MKQHLSHTPGPIGVFDSGYGGLTILDKIREVLPEYDYIYLGDNARAPYGTRSFEVVYEFTRQAVNKLFDMGCCCQYTDMLVFAYLSDTLYGRADDAEHTASRIDAW